MSTPNTFAKCEFCGDNLKQVVIPCLNREVTATFFGSCGCKKSKDKLNSFTAQYHDSCGHRCPICGGSMEVDYRNWLISDCPYCGYSCVFHSDIEARNHQAFYENHPNVLEETGVPQRYWDVEPDFESAEQIIKSGKGFYIVGKNGTHKTLKASCIARAFAEKGAKVRFISSVKLISEFRDSFGSDNSEVEIFRALKSCDLLIIDDLGKENPSSWVASMIYAVIDERYGLKKPIIITTNFRENELISRIAGEFDESTARAIMSRICEMTTKIETSGADLRLAV